MSSPSRKRSKIAKFMLWLILVFIAIVLIVRLVPLPLDHFIPEIEAAISEETGWDISMEGPLTLTTGTAFYVNAASMTIKGEVSGVAIEGTTHDVAINLAILPLLTRGDVSIVGMSARNITATIAGLTHPPLTLSIGQIRSGALPAEVGDMMALFNRAESLKIEDLQLTQQGELIASATMMKAERQSGSAWQLRISGMMGQKMSLAAIVTPENAEHFLFHDLTFSSPATTATGSGTFSFSDARPAITGTLSTKQVTFETNKTSDKKSDADKNAPMLADDADADPSNIDESAIPLPLPLPVDADITVDIGQFTLDGINRLHHSLLTFSSTVEHIRVQLQGWPQDDEDQREGSAPLYLQLTAANQLPTSIESTLRINHMPLSAWLGEGYVEGGTSHAVISLTAVGDDVSALRQSASGQGSLLMMEGRYVLEDINTLWKPVVALLAGDREVTRLSLPCAYAGFALNQSQVTIEPLVIETQGSRVAGQGQVMLDARTVKLTLKPRAKTIGLADFTTPVLISGPWDDLSVLPDPKATLKEAGIGALMIGTGVGTAGILGYKLLEKLGALDDATPCQINSEAAPAGPAMPDVLSPSADVPSPPGETRGDSE